jgi:8-oxo-dGTP pyrophosphatase MutT (NUDIX family)
MQIPTHTVLLLLKGDEILLGMKKRGFGKGNYLGIGGKIEKGESSLEGVVRECREEIGVELEKPKFHGQVKFNFLARPKWNSVVDVYSSETWAGVPAESEEIRPEWFKRSELPLEQMWYDNRYWLPLVLEGKLFNAEFDLREDLRVHKYTVLFG